jgi:hypothetical protein
MIYWDEAYLLITKMAQKLNHPLPGLLMTNLGLILSPDLKVHTYRSSFPSEIWFV